MFVDKSTLVKDDTIVDGSFDSDFEYVFVDIIELHSIMFWTIVDVVLVICEDDSNAHVCSVLA